MATSEAGAEDRNASGVAGEENSGDCQGWTDLAKVGAEVAIGLAADQVPLGKLTRLAIRVVLGQGVGDLQTEERRT
jgi:hypothetical protein